jgi:uncharacterized protein
MKRLRFRPGFSSLVPPIAWGTVAVLLILFIFRYVGLQPRVDQNFFFSANDPQVQVDRLISQTFVQEPQLILSARGDIRSPRYLRKVRGLTDELSTLPEVDTVESLARGPRDTDQALKSPLWSRVLLSKDQKASFIYVWVKQHAPLDKGVRGIEEVTQRLNAPDFPLMISGAPYIVELIQRNLMRDLKVFSIAAFCVFGLSGLAISRSLLMVLGTLIACTNASAGTLILTRTFGIPVGPLTANLSTILFVLTLTHMVFMTFNWRHIVQTGETSARKAWWRAVRVTLLPSFLSMITALLGFLSLLFVPATPLRQLGISGTIGTVVAFLSAYVIYPWFLKAQRAEVTPKRKTTRASAENNSFFATRHGRIAALILLASVAASIGLWKLNTEPSIFSYFKKGSSLRNSLEYFDQNGGSIPLNIVIGNPGNVPLKIDEVYPRLWRLQTALEQDPFVGSVMSLTLLLAEAKARYPFLTSFIPLGWVLKALESRFFKNAAKYYITKDQTETLLILRMKEMSQQSDRLATVERLKGTVRKEGFEPMLAGGIYVLYGKLSKLVESSLIEGLILLTALFTLMGGIISRSFRAMGAVFISLAIIPILMLGLLGHFRLPLDIISAPGANIAIGIGVDAMIHVLVWVRRDPSGVNSWEAWSAVCSRLWKPILYSMSVVSAGFGIFMVSGFPPTQRFGLSVVLGTLLTPLSALFVLPWFATFRPFGAVARLKRRRGRRASPSKKTSAAQKRQAP